MSETPSPESQTQRPTRDECVEILNSVKDKVEELNTILGSSLMMTLDPTTQGLCIELENQRKRNHRQIRMIQERNDLIGKLREENDLLRRAKEASAEGRENDLEVLRDKVRRLIRELEEKCGIIRQIKAEHDHLTGALRLRVAVEDELRREIADLRLQSSNAVAKLNDVEATYRKREEDYKRQVGLLNALVVNEYVRVVGKDPLRLEKLELERGWLEVVARIG